MSELRLELLGLPRITHGDEVVTLQRRRSVALLGYLAIIGRPASRDSLAFLLAGDLSDEQARKHLRNALTDLRHLIGDHLVVTTQAVAFNRGEPYWLDVEDLERTARTAGESDTATLESAMALYESELLAGLNIRDSPAFDEWLALERARIHTLVAQIAAQLVVRHEERHEWPAAITLSRRLLALEPWNEEGHRRLIRLLARDNQRAAALAHYATCRRILADELGVEPDAETQALHALLRAVPVAPPHNLPAQTTSFVGRARELAVLKLRLVEPTCRFVTILGLGGSGKTRLAIEVALGFTAPPAVLDEHPFADGIYFVAFADALPHIPHNTEDEGADIAARSLATAIGHALGMTFQGNSDPVKDVAVFLRSKTLLLVLDNLGAVASGHHLLATLTAQAPKVTILATSRVRLGLEEEWVLEVSGLALPTGSNDLERADASRLFLDQVERLQLGTPFTTEDRSAIVRICTLVEGVPLAVKLAATWRRGLSCAAIAMELERGMNLLTTTDRGIPARHQSLRAVLTTSWHQLSEQERQIVEWLSVFRNGFTPAAAYAVAGASVRGLLRLRDHALLTARGEGRYFLHELVRQYAMERLTARPDEENEAHQRHAEYFARLVHQQVPELYQGREAGAEIAADIANVRAAWTWAVAHRAFALLETMQEGLGIWYELSGPYSEWEEVLREAENPVRVALTDASRPHLGVRALLGALVVGRARACTLQGRLDAVSDMLDEAQQLARSVGAVRLNAIVAFNRLHLLIRSGNFRAAQEAGEGALALLRVVDMSRWEALTSVYLADVVKELGSSAQADTLLDRAHAGFHALSDQQGEIRVANNRSRNAYARGRFDEAAV